MVTTESQGHPATCHEQCQLAGMIRDRGRRTSSGPAAISAAPTGRTYDRSRPNRSNRQKTACRKGPSTYDKRERSAYVVDDPGGGEGQSIGAIITLTKVTHHVVWLLVGAIPMSAELQDPRFTDETAAREALEAIVWPNGPVCPHCGNTDQARSPSSETKSARPGLRYCNECKGQFTATVGTIFERSKIPLTKWWLAMHLIGSSKKGISSHQLHRMLGVSYKTTWFMMHRIREAMRVGDLAPMGGEGSIVEIDETFIGRKEGFEEKRGFGHKNTVLTLVERGGTARSFHVEDATKENIVPIVRANLDRESHVMTDEAGQYAKLGNEFAEHDAVDHSRDEYGYTRPRDRREDQHEHDRGLLLDFQARHEGRLSALRRKAFTPLSGRVRFPLFKSFGTRR